MGEKLFQFDHTNLAGVLLYIRRPAYVFGHWGNPATRARLIMVFRTAITQPSIHLSDTSIEHRTVLVRHLSDYKHVSSIARTSHRQVDDNGCVHTSDSELVCTSSLNVPRLPPYFIFRKRLIQTAGDALIIAILSRMTCGNSRPGS